jgi:hypothetical protein
LSGKDLRRHTDAELTGEPLTDGLPLLEMVDLLGDDLDELRQLLKLGGHELNQLLQLEELLLLESLHLLELLRDDLQQLQDLLRGLRGAEAVPDRLYRQGLIRLLRRPADRRHGIRRWCADAKCRSGELTH